ncbi:peptide ABC transporter substrate-binding protein [bacterium]|nr:MAG: peptide ABC transporter substrate-binding protein [bacterium]
MLRRILTLALTLAIVAGCTKVSGTSGDGEHPWSNPGILRIGLQTDFKTLNPMLAGDTTDAFAGRLMFEMLVDADEHGHPIPDLAAQVPSVDNGGISKDGLTITYHLRKDVRWHDGAPFTAKDVVWSWQAMINDANNVVSRRGFDDVRSIDTPDEYTAVVHLKQRYAPFVNTFFAESDSPTPVLPAHLLARYKNINEIPFNSHPIGDGPFEFVKWDRGIGIDLKANPHYFHGIPGLKQIRLRIIPDENTLLTELRTHEIDWYFEATPDMYFQIKSLPDIKTVVVPTNGYDSVLMNTQSPFLKDVRVRQAIAYVVDKHALAQKVGKGSVDVATEDLPHWMWAYNPKVKLYDFNPKKAAALLDQAGWKLGPDGYRYKNGQRLALTITYQSSSSTGKTVGVLLQAWLKQIGITGDVKVYPGDVYFAPYGMGGILARGKFDLSLSGWVAGIDPDNSSQFLCSTIPPAGYNYTRFCDPAMDAAQHDALVNYDLATRKRAYAKIETILAEQMPQDFYDWRNQVHGINVDFKNFKPNPVNEAWNAWQWTI